MAGFGKQPKIVSPHPAQTSDKLDIYRSKRIPDRMPEPVPPPAPNVAASTEQQQPIFVIQRHDASRLHWDFRLERDGVLVSWAVPKGPPLDTKTNRLAVQTEDRSEEHTSELQSRGHLVCRLLLEKK